MSVEKCQQPWLAWFNVGLRGSAGWFDLERKRSGGQRGMVAPPSEQKCICLVKQDVTYLLLFDVKSRGAALRALARWRVRYGLSGKDWLAMTVQVGELCKGE